MTKWRWITTAVASLFAVVWFVPVLYSLVISFKNSNTGISDLKKLFAPPFTLDNYNYVLHNGQADIMLWTLNSFIVSVSITIGVMIICSTAAFAFSFLDFVGKKFWFWVAMAGFILPVESTLVPLYILMRDLNLLNTYASLIFPHLAAPFAIIILRQFFIAIPRELFEAARIDGCKSWRIYRTVVMPLSKPIIATLGIFIFLGGWNDFIWPYISITDQRIMTIPVGLPFFNSQHNPDIGMPLAASMLAIAPVLLVFLFLQRYIIKGITFTGIKG